MMTCSETVNKVFIGNLGERNSSDAREKTVDRLLKHVSECLKGHFTIAQLLVKSLL